MKLRNVGIWGTAAILLWSGAGDAAYASVKVTGSTTAIAAEATAEILKQATVVHIVAVTNLRKGPGMEHDIVGKAQAGDTYKIEGIEGDWFKIALPSGSKAYVANWVVETDASAQPEQPVSEQPGSQQPGSGDGNANPGGNVEPAATMVHIVAVTNLRSGPGMDYDVVSKAKSGDAFRIDGSEGEWYRILLVNGSKAYVAKWVVKTGEVPHSESLVYIYHTHNRESWKNVARSTKGGAYDDREINITLVGKHMAEVLSKKDIPAIAENADIATRLTEQKLSYSQSYAESGKVVSNAVNTYASLSYFFDIHRDADVPRSKTTASINKKSYAKVMFVIGTANPNYKENKKFADALNAIMNKKYPGMSRGVLLKSSHQGNGEYNQSVSPGSLLMEFGGVNNTLEENLNTAEAFADVFAEYLKQQKAAK
ncbi:stage II sporulation protein P [Paenibacillus sp. CAU 1782]